MSENLYAHIERATPADRETTVLEDDGGTHFSWQDLHAATARYAAALTALGAVPGDRVAVQVEKSPQSLFLYLACLRAGLTYLPLNTAYRRTELGYFIADAEPAIVVCAPQSRDEIREVSGAHTTLLTLDENGEGSLAEAAASMRPEFPVAAVEADHLAAIIYTSGTTGRSKGAMVTHRNLSSNARTLVAYWKFDTRDVLLHALPIFHVHGLFVANHCALLSGARMLWHRRFDAKAVLRDLPRATVFMGVPTFYTRLLAEPAFGPRGM